MNKEEKEDILNEYDTHFIADSKRESLNQTCKELGNQN